MRAPGLAAFRRGTPSRYSFESRALPLAPGFLKQLRAAPRAGAVWQAEPPGYRRLAAFWVMSAKQQETRERRFAILLDCLARGKRIPELQRPSK
jgi:uncharacterized protein YdeI (YjbR/CyaY-like superfamily)